MLLVRNRSLNVEVEVAGRAAEAEDEDEDEDGVETPVAEVGASPRFPGPLTSLPEEG